MVEDTLKQTGEPSQTVQAKSKAPWVQQLRTQTSFNLLAFRRNPAATFFTVILPLIFLVVFTSVFGNEELDSGRRVATLYVPAILSMAIMSATFVNLAMTLTTRRERGVLKRVRATPLRPWVFIVAQGLAGMVLSFLMTVLFIGVGWLFFGVGVNAVGVLPLIITVVVSSICFSALGVALTVIIPSEQAAPAVTNALVLPLYFISDIFFVPGDDGSRVGGVIGFVASLFPVKHLAQAATESFNPFAESMPFPVLNWVVILLWGLVGLGVSLWKFRWSPSR